MTPDISSMKLALKTMLDSSPWEDDFETDVMPWNEAEFQKVQDLAAKKDGNLCFGIMQWDGNVQPHPPVARAIRLVIEALTEQGYEVLHTSFGV
jgi:amidase